MPGRPLSDAHAIAVLSVGLLLVSLVGLASGGSPWHAGGGQEVPASVVRVFAAAGGALVIGSLLVAWVGTPSAERRGRRRKRLGASDLEGLGASLSAGGKAAAIVGGAIGLLLLAALPFLSPDAAAPPGATPGNGATHGPASGSVGAERPTSVALTWLAVGSAAALLLAPAAVVVRRRRARRERRAVVPDEVSRVGLELRRSLADLESEPDPRLAVQRAYARMEESLGEIELLRAPDETPAEFTARVLRVLGVSAVAASDLTGLFEIARFSDHPMDEDDRRRAIASVRRVEAEVAPR
ncbi:MAG: DUF4129 domain-containing protein [Gaiella sp.]